MSGGRASRSQTSDTTVWSGDGWELRLNRPSRSVELVVTDYHAGPLRLSSRELHDLGKLANGRTNRFRRRGLLGAAR
jgi:hypothetical protein